MNACSVSYTDLITALAERGWFWREDFIAAGLVAALYQELRAHHQGRRLKAAGVGQGRGHRLNSAVRGDKTLWLDGATAAQGEYLSLMEELRVRLNRELFLGVREYECHFALYEPGAFYKRHLDAFRDSASRVVSTVLYLAPDWMPEHGGLLRLYADTGDASIAAIVPQAGSFVCFLSAAVPHEVETAHRSRASIAGWFRTSRQPRPAPVNR